MNARWTTAALLVTVGVAVGTAWTAHAGEDDDDDEDEPVHSSVESWPPTKVSWPPLTVPEERDGEAAPPVIGPP